MKLIQLIMLMVALLALQACGFKDVPDVDVKEAILYSPEGEFEFKRDNKIPYLYVANNGNYRISTTLFPLKKINYLYIKSIANKSIYDVKITINYDNTYYTFNDEEKIKLNIEKNSQTKYTIISPNTMDYYNLDGDGLHVTRQRLRLTKKDKNKVDDETYRYYIPFTLDGEKYAIDITFQLDIDTTLRFGVPGMP